MVVGEAIKNYIAEKYGDGNCVTTSSGDNLGLACMTDSLKTPLPVGYTKADICTEEVITFAYDNVGWCKGVPAEVPEAIKIYIAEKYGDGSCITVSSGDDLGKGCMTNTLKTPLPSGYTKDDICAEAVITFAYNNIGWCTTAEKGYLKINTSPTGASVRVGTTECGLTPVLACELSTGWKTVTITKTGYQTETRTVEIKVGATSDLGTITLTATAVAGKGWVVVGTYPAGFKIKIDGITEVTSSPSLPEESRREVDALTTHTIEISQFDYETETDTVYVREGEEETKHYFPKFVGSGSAVLVISAWDKDTGDELVGATFGIYGMSGEDKYKLPTTIGVKPGDYRIIANYPGYSEGVATGKVEEDETKEVKVQLGKAVIWEVVEIVERLPTAAWITDVDLDSPMVRGLVYVMSADVIITKSGKYQVDFILYPEPPGWDRTLGSLLAGTPRPEIWQSAIESLSPYPTTKKKIKWSQLIATTIPIGTYIIVARLYEVV